MLGLVLGLGLGMAAACPLQLLSRGGYAQLRAEVGGQPAAQLAWLASGLALGLGLGVGVAVGLGASDIPCYPRRQLYLPLSPFISLHLPTSPLSPHISPHPPFYL